MRILTAFATTQKHRFAIAVNFHCSKFSLQVKAKLSRTTKCYKNYGRMKPNIVASLELACFVRKCCYT